jgi:hypothetical protein
VDLGCGCSDNHHHPPPPPLRRLSGRQLRPQSSIPMATGGRWLVTPTTLPTHPLFSRGCPALLTESHSAAEGQPSSHRHGRGCICLLGGRHSSAPHLFSGDCSVRPLPPSLPFLTRPGSRELPLPPPPPPPLQMRAAMAILCRFPSPLLASPPPPLFRSLLSSR